MVNQQIIFSISHNTEEMVNKCYFYNVTITTNKN